jgi:hypothetical protein
MTSRRYLPTPSFVSCAPHIRTLGELLLLYLVVLEISESGRNVILKVGIAGSMQHWHADVVKALVLTSDVDAGTNGQEAGHVDGGEYYICIPPPEFESCINRFERIKIYFSQLYNAVNPESSSHRFQHRIVLFMMVRNLFLFSNFRYPAATLIINHVET